MTVSSLLAIRDVSVVFGGIVALNGVSFDLNRGQILGLIGPNGAGKTTLFNCLSRLYQPSSGDILMEGASILARPPHRIAEIGIGRTFQNVALFPNLSATMFGSAPTPYAHSAVTVVQAPAASLRGASKNRNAKQFWAQFSWQAARDWPGSRKRRSPLCLRRPAVQKATCVRIANASNLAPAFPLLVGLTCLATLPCR
jgi:ABC-type oligopeptide transport system ATPase subunit